jgi:SsrA-binding protein
MSHIIHKLTIFATFQRYLRTSSTLLLHGILGNMISHKRVSFDFEILDTMEAGISLLGTEVKSVRNGQGKLEGAYVIIRGKEAFLVGASIPAFQKKNVSTSYDPERPRKLLLTKKELAELELKSEKQGLTIVPIKLYNKSSKLKLEIAIAKGKKKQDKRQSIKERDTNRDIARELRPR